MYQNLGSSVSVRKKAASGPDPFPVVPLPTLLLSLTVTWDSSGTHLLGGVM